MTAPPDPHRPATRPPRGWPALLLIWLPLMVAYAIAIIRFAEIDAARGIRGAAINSVIASLLGIGVWVLSGRVRWPERPGIGFLTLHVAVAVLYSVAWWSLVVATGAVLNGRPMAADFAEWLASDTIGWDLFLGLTVYGLATGISYAIRLRAAVTTERLAVARLEAATRAARLHALEARLDPHVLFNTLHSVAALVRHDPARAEDAIDTLGELLREALRDPEGGERRLDDELRLVEGYLALERLRLGERLQVVMDIADDARALPVPPLLLQPLVENAIRHGLAPLAEGGRVTLSARREGEDLHLGVADNGAGAAGPPGTDDTGLGLGVLAERLAQREPMGRMTITTAPQAGFRVDLALPGGSR